MRGFLGAGRLDNANESDEFGDDNFSHDASKLYVALTRSSKLLFCV
jgi:hypothetical protein